MNNKKNRISDNCGNHRDGVKGVDRDGGLVFCVGGVWNSGHSEMYCWIAWSLLISSVGRHSAS